MRDQRVFTDEIDRTKTQVIGAFPLVTIWRTPRAMMDVFIAWSIIHKGFAAFFVRNPVAPAFQFPEPYRTLNGCVPFVAHTVIIVFIASRLDVQPVLVRLYLLRKSYHRLSPAHLTPFSRIPEQREIKIPTHNLNLFFSSRYGNLDPDLGNGPPSPPIARLGGFSRIRHT
jgi:hypothetical protein